MTLVLQCAACGTCHPVGTPACTTCRATGVQNLRLLFECPACFRLGLSPECEACRPLPYEIVEEPDEVLALEPTGGEFELIVDEDFGLDDGDDFDLLLDLE